MENASKALLMAGGVLIAVLVIGLFGYMFTSMSGVFQSEEDIEAIQEIEKYNKEYLSYNRKLLRGADVLTLMNKVSDNYIKYDKEEEYKITIKYKLQGGSYQTTIDNLTEFKRKIFDCDGVNYNSAGRISEMSFTERVVNEY